VINVRDIAAVVTDIEGTTTSLAFVKEQLFPYARRHLAAYVRSHASRLGEIAAQIRALTGREQLATEEMISLLLRWMDEDQKITPLKSLQGMIWRTGYERGELQGHVYEDAVRALTTWHASGIPIYIYSSGSVEAQKLLFAHSSSGDLTPLLAGYFDTSTGAKVASHSYSKIAAAVGAAPRAMLFLSDHPAETAAATAAGMRSILLAREQQPSSGPDPVATSFDEIVLSR
jgi:enolase-phosphatase E1